MGVETMVLSTFAAAGVAGGGQVYSAYQSRKSQKAAEKADKVRQRMEEARARREKVRMLASARRQRAELQVAGSATGTSQSSGRQAGIGDISTQLGRNMSFLDTMQAGMNKIGKLTNQANRYNYNAQLGQAVGQIASSAFTAVGGMSNFLPSTSIPNPRSNPNFNGPR